MTTYANPPPELANAIKSSSQKYGVPVDILTGVWRRESGSSFPNNFKNSSGYGGLFGTTNWNGSTQSQSDYAASILANLYNHYGTWSAALYHYSGGAYTSVAGQTTSGGTFDPHPSGQNVGSSSSGGNPLDIAGAIGSFTSTVANIPNTIMSDLKPVGISVGIGLVAVVLIVGGILVIALAVVNKAADQPIVKTAASAIP